MRKPLLPDYPGALACGDPAQAVAELERQTPDVLIFAFRAAADAERHYLGLYRASAHLHRAAHRSIVLDVARVRSVHERLFR